ncbi:efflux transporter outer membrane subunit [Massilia sp. TS11]|uniref:efflux transporter outer membrane subunit n=1 Tax=Massilia sp. TS11 TaxID=2908003 RepID=UPI001EDB2D68|nr:efflux transporter outer membrane subunit [Massilia sp. TS11]MCG2582911.1 efflux transporter outer membrane subunit [Massilia sp. TS11]
MTAFRLSPLVLALGLAACSLAPTYERPAAPVAASYPAGASAAGAAAAALAWRDFFTDARLQTLIATALEQNRDLRTAALRIEEARALYRIQRADQIPNLSASADMQRGRTPQMLSASGASTVGKRYDAGLAVPAFELDFFGRVRSLSEAALATYLASEEARKAAQISLVAEVARAWYTERAYAEQLALATRSFEARSKTYALVQRRLEVGASSRLELRQQETLLEAARSAMLTLTRQRAQAENALAVLVGQPLPAAGSAPVQDVLPALAAGLPSDLLAQRPDILAAEQRLKAANANIGAARAAFFPRISLTAALGSSSPSLDGLFDAGTRSWSFVPQLTQPIFDAGRLSANADLATVRKQIAVADYEKTIQVAFREVADALAARDTAGAQLSSQEAARAASAERLKLLQLRQTNGVASSLDILDAERELFSAEQAVVQARLQRSGSAIDLYKALGGGLK